MSSALDWLNGERKYWWKLSNSVRKRAGPSFRFVARPSENPDGTRNMWVWDCVIPGPKDTIWAPGLYTLKVMFPYDYPFTAPKCHFDPPLFHPNIYSSGTICLPILDNDKEWIPGTTIEEILFCIQSLLVNPNEKCPAHADAYDTFIRSKQEYEHKVKEQTKKFTPAGTE